MPDGPNKAGVSPILILGGTSEASTLARALHAEGVDVVLSLAGRTASPKREPVPTRIGGFGGADGLAVWLAGNDIAQVVDATHPFAARISANAALACARAGVTLLAVRRPAWERRPGDTWIEVDDMAAAAAALGAAPRRVFLTVGRQALAAFAAVPQHVYYVRTIEPIAGAPALRHLTEIRARGPFTVVAEAAFLREAGIERLVTKNAGGAATYAKIAAARDLGLPVVMVRRPVLPEVPAVPDAQAAFERLVGAR